MLVWIRDVVRSTPNLIHLPSTANRRRSLSASAKIKTAAICALAAAILSYFGFIRSSGVGVGDGFGMAPSITVAYLVVAAILYWTDSMAKAEIGAGSSEAAAGD